MTWKSVESYFSFSLVRVCLTSTTNKQQQCQREKKTIEKRYLCNLSYVAFDVCMFCCSTPLIYELLMDILLQMRGTSNNFFLRSLLSCNSPGFKFSLTTTKWKWILREWKKRTFLNERMKKEQTAWRNMKFNMKSIFSTEYWNQLVVVFWIRRWCFSHSIKFVLQLKNYVFGARTLFTLPMHYVF